MGLVLSGLSLACTLGGSAPPTGALSSKEHDFYRSRASFAELFHEARRVRLEGVPEFALSPRPLIKAVNQRGDLIVVDKYNVRNVFVFGSDGRPKGRIGSEGRQAGQYLFPNDLFYDPRDRNYYIYDGDLMRISRFSGDFGFVRQFTVPLMVESILVTSQDRLFGYSAVVGTAKASGDMLYEVDRQGRILGRFARRPNSYSGWVASEQGGVVEVRGFLYLSTPYEYSISIFSQDGERLLSREYASPHYVPPHPPPQLNDRSQVPEAFVAYQQSYSDLRQILSFDDKMIGVVFSEPEGIPVFLSLFGLDLTPLAQDLELPPYLGDLFAAGDRLYLMSPQREERLGMVLNPVVVEYELKQPVTPRTAAAGPAPAHSAPMRGRLDPR